MDENNEKYIKFRSKAIDLSLTKLDFSASLLRRELNIDHELSQKIMKDLKDNGIAYSAGYERRMIKHRYAAWCAGRAASSVKGHRFTVKQCQQIIENVTSLYALSTGWRMLLRVTDFDTYHKNVRDKIITEGKKFNLDITDGIAAKIINVYIKTLCVVPMLHMYERLSPHEQKFYLNMIHPPIDRVLLLELAKKNEGGYAKMWREFAKKGWSNFNAEDYEKCISLIREVTKGQLWRIETNWLGHQ